MTFFTICTRGYLPRALHLADSVRVAHPGSLLVLVMCERQLSNHAQIANHFDMLICATEIGIDDCELFMLRHDETEACTAIKAAALLAIQALLPNESQFVYLDSDIWVLSRFKEVEQALQNHDIILTPHQLGEQFRFDEIIGNLFPVMLNGVYNLGFFAINKSAVSTRFLLWWNSLLKNFCYVDRKRGLFFDQRWIDIAPSLFPVHSLHHPGYNVAKWNIARRNITCSDGMYSVNGEPLRFYHFSGSDTDDDQKYFGRDAPLANHPVRQLRSEFKDRIEARKTEEKSEWSYNRFLSGEKLSRDLRLSLQREWVSSHMREPPPEMI
jgi:hypothetical protein